MVVKMDYKQERQRKLIFAAITYPLNILRSIRAPLIYFLNANGILQLA